MSRPFKFALQILADAFEDVDGGTVLVLIIFFAFGFVDHLLVGHTFPIAPAMPLLMVRLSFFVGRHLLHWPSINPDPPFFSLQLRLGVLAHLL